MGGVAKKTRKFAAVKRVIGQRDARLKKNQEKQDAVKEARSKAPGNELIREIPQAPSQMFFQHNTALAPPYPILLDTNFLSHTIRCKLPLLETLMDTFLATVRPMITSCVMAELEKLGPKYRLALQIARDERFERLTCDHKGVYADDCIVDRCVKQRIYVVATNDKDLKRRIRKIPGVPIVSVARGKYLVERWVILTSLQLASLLTYILDCPISQKGDERDSAWTEDKVSVTPHVFIRHEAMT
jgi:U3 small nucleolar RNA-associated protein 24